MKLFSPLLFCILWSGQIYADKKAVESFSQALLSVETMTGRFTQRIIDSDELTRASDSGKDNDASIQTTEGNFIIKRPGYFLWHVSPPYEQLIIGSPGSLKMYDPDLEQMTIHAQDSLSGTPASLISGDVTSIDQNYDVRLTQNKKIQTYTLTEKGEGEGAFESLTFVFSTKSKDSLLLEMSFIDKLGQKVEILISQQKNNPRIEDSAFDFEPPKGTDIIIDG